MHLSLPALTHQASLCLHTVSAAFLLARFLYALMHCLHIFRLFCASMFSVSASRLVRAVHAFTHASCTHAIIFSSFRLLMHAPFSVHCRYAFGIFARMLSSYALHSPPFLLGFFCMHDTVRSCSRAARVLSCAMHRQHHILAFACMFSVRILLYACGIFLMRYALPYIFLLCLHPFGYPSACCAAALLLYACAHIFSHA